MQWDRNIGVVQDHTAAIHFLSSQQKWSFMTPRERELLQGMGNCYDACHADFEDTVRMVGGARGLKPEEVKTVLSKMKERYGDGEEYKTLRSRLPEDFPL